MRDGSAPEATGQTKHDLLSASSLPSGEGWGVRGDFIGLLFHTPQLSPKATQDQMSDTIDHPTQRPAKRKASAKSLLAKFLTPEPVSAVRKQLYAVQVTYTLRQGRETHVAKCRGVLLATDEIDAIALIQFRNRHAVADMYCVEKFALLIPEQLVRQQCARDLGYNLSEV